MSEWKEYRLGDVLIFQRGHDLPRTEMIEGIYPVAGSNGIIGFHSKYTTKGPGITIGRSGNIGTPHFYKNDFWAHNTVLYVKDFKGNSELFLFYLLKSLDFAQFNTGSAVPSLNRNHIHELYVKIPTLPEQRAIASVLSSLDDKIDLLHRQNATLEKMAETLFRQWFVEEAKEEWDVETFGKWIKETAGGEWGKEKAEGDFNKVVYCIRGTDIADLNTGLPLKTPIRFVKEAKFRNIEPHEGDLIIEISGGTENQSTGRICYINQDVKSLFNQPLVFSNFCRMIRVKKAEYSFFLYCYIQYLYSQDEFFNLENGSSGIKNLDYKALLFELEYRMPNEKLVLNFHKQIEPVFKKVNHNKIQVRTLITLRDTLLPKLMAGEIKVKI